VRRWKFRVRPPGHDDLLTNDRVSIGIRIALRQNVTMNYTAAVVLLLTIAGAPVTTLACVGWCVPDAMPVSASCHHHGTGAGASVMDADDTCARLLAATPFVKEELQLTRTATTASIPYALSSAVQGAAQLVSVHDVAPAVLHRSTSSLVLRL
jgi:hypothetical protein